MQAARSTAVDARPVPSGMSRHRGLSGGETIETLGVASEELVLRLWWQMPDHLLDGGDAVRPGGIRVGVIRLAHDVVLADLIETGDTVMVLNEATEDVFAEQLPDVERVQIDVRRRRDP